MSSQARAIGERRLALLQALTTRVGEAHSLGEAAALFEAALRTSPDELPFSAIYLLEREHPRARLAMAAGASGRRTLPESIPVEAGDPWRFADALEHDEPILVRLAAGSPIPSPERGADPPAEAAVLRLLEPFGAQRLGVFAAGLNPARVFDEGYRSWVRLVAAWIGVGLARAHAYETDRRQSAALEESEHRFARFMNHLPGLAWLKDPAGRYRFVNEAAARAFGRFQEQILGKTDEEIFPPATAAEFRKNDARALAGGGATETVETLEHEDGVHHSLVSKFPIPVGLDGSSMIGGIAIDITDRIRIEEALREAHRHKDEFLATLAHELRSPLAPLRNALEVVRVAGEADPEALARARGIMERQLRQMVRLIDDLLDVSRISRGKVELRKERLTLAAVLESALETMRPTLDGSGRDLVLDLPAEPVFLEADFTRLAQVFANLLHNAVKYTEQGGQLRLQARREGASIVVRVKDDGVGIPAESLPRVFDMFTQVDRSTGASRGGLGVGLSIVRNLVTLHGGTVEALSEGPGRGAEFVVRLPVLSASAPDASNPPESVTPIRPARRRILVVDDNPDSADCLALLLEMKGNDVRTAHDGSEALGAAEAFRPDVIFLDLGMPGLDGHAVCRRLRSQAWGRALPIVALTGWSQEEDRRRSQESGFTHHLVKPAEPAVLDRLLADLPSPPPVVRPSN
jgi:PAS domain S-box-containing protein